MEADGRLFDISKGCLIDGEYIFPGELINCACSFAPVIEEPGDEEEIKKEIEKNRYYRKIATGDKK